MVEKKGSEKLKRRYPEFWDKSIPAAVILIVLIIIFLMIITVRVALGLTAF